MIYRAKILGISLARRKTRRRFLVCYWMVLLLLDFLPVGVLRPTLPSVLLMIALVTPLLWITIRLWGVNPGQGITRDFEDRYAATGEGDYPPIDERETAVRDHAHYLALRFIRVLLAIAVFGSGLISEKFASRIRGEACGLLFLLLWILPQTIVLWNEPDMETPDER